MKSKRKERPGSGGVTVCNGMVVPAEASTLDIDAAEAELAQVVAGVMAEASTLDIDAAEAELAQVVAGVMAEVSTSEGDCNGRSGAGSSS